MRKKEQRVIEYSDELNDEFSSFKTTPPKIDGSYDYLPGGKLWKLKRFLAYRMIAFPIAFLYSKIAFHRKIVGKKQLKPYKKTGLFLYGNHTQPTGDALMQAVLTYPRTNYVIVHPNNLAIPVIGRFTPLLGALPLPDDMAAYRSFKKAIETRIEEGHPVVVYPEAHIWPYYTKIRPFSDVSFEYPTSLNKPSFCFTNTYIKRRFGKKPKIVTYIDGPFFPNERLDRRSRRKDLRDRIYSKMTERAANSTVEVIKYIKKEDAHGQHSVLRE